MKKIFSLVVISLCLVVLASCFESKTYEIALITDVGNIDDKSFNQGAWTGVKEYAEENSLSYSYYRPSEDTDAARLESIKTSIDNGAKIVVCPGYLFETAIYEAQTLYPNVKFLLLDGEPHTADYKTYKTEANVHCILYQEEQAGYLAGYAVVMDGYRNLGFIGGMDVPAVIRFGQGYVQGAEKAATELGLAAGAVTIKYNYSGSFSPSADLKTKMDGWYATGTEVIFSCGGGIYLSVTGAATEAGKKVVGVDVDQHEESSTIITSAEKKLTQSVKLALAALYQNNGEWDATRAGTTAVLGADDDCVGLPTNSDAWRFNSFTVAQYNAIYELVKNGTIVVDNKTDVHPATTLVTVDWAA